MVLVLLVLGAAACLAIGDWGREGGSGFLVRGWVPSSMPVLGNVIAVAPSRLLFYFSFLASSCPRNLARDPHIDAMPTYTTANCR